MFKLLSANRIRLKKSRLFLAGVFFLIGFGLLLLIMNYIQQTLYAEHYTPGIHWLNVFLFLSFPLVSLFCSFFSSIFIGTEYSDGTIRNRLVVGHMRTNIYLANFITISFAMILMMLCSNIIVAFLASVLLQLNIEQERIFLEYYFVGIMMLLSFSGLFTMLATVLHNKITSVIVSILIFLIGCMGELFIQKLLHAFYHEHSISDVVSFLSEDMLSLPVLEFLYDFFPMGQLIQLVSGTISRPLTLTIYSTIFTVITVVFGLLIFRKKEIK